MAADREFAIRTKGLGSLNRALSGIDKGMQKNVKRHLRETAKEVRNDARPLAPFRTGALARSFRYTASNRGAAVRSSLPYAGVHEYGGTIEPRGTPITIERSRFFGRSVQKNTARIEHEVGVILEMVARHNGFH